MDNNNIQNNINDINLNKEDEKNENGNNSKIIFENINNENSNIKIQIKTQNNNDLKLNPEENNKKIKYRINFSVKIEQLRNDSDKSEKISQVEFDSNILLMSSEVNQSNKISCLTLISFINFKKNHALYIYYLNKKIFKYLQILTGIESFIYIRTLYRAAFFLEKDKNYFYAFKYILEAEKLSNNSKIDNLSKKFLWELKDKIIKEINEYKNKYINKFTEIGNSQNLCEEKYIRMQKLIKDLIENKYQIDNEENNEGIENNDKYSYLINRKWVERAYNFLQDYINIRENKIKKSKRPEYFNYVFDPDMFYKKYFDIDEKYKYKYNPFPGLIDNYSISDWTDNWNDPLNEDENNYIKSNLIYNKDYYLLEKTDFEFLNEFFGATNIIKRKKECLDFIIIKSFIFDKRLGENDNIFLLRKRNLQIRKNTSILNFKKKILRCIEDSLKTVEEEKKNNTPGNNNNKKDINNITDNKNEINVGLNKEKESLENKNKDNSKDIKNNKYNIHFYILEKENKDILIEMCISFVNGISQYESLYIKNIELSDNENITQLLAFFNEKKHILIIEIQHNDDPLFLKDIPKNKYFCRKCMKSISTIENKYNCNICHLSLFCSEECSNRNENHKKLDYIYCNEYLVEEFDLKIFLKKNMNNFFKPDQLKGLVGLSNLGNTCYMNSALQCLSNTFDLTKYFLLNYYKNDINRGNRLGSNGTIAGEYYKLIYSMWCEKDPIIAPREFISKFQKEKKQFSGYRQQDSQEFISILLDQLHEDLNRISNKPYVELLEKQPNEDDIIASKRWWDLHKKREDSIIIDLFNGQLKSETTCQVCGKSSITYDPFMFLCLPLPKTKTNFVFKIFWGIECKTFIFEYFDKCTLLDLKNKAIESIKENNQSNTNNFDLEVVQLDSDKKIIEIISTNKNDKNYKGNIELKNFLINKREIIFFEKNIYKYEDEYINVFVYPIENQFPTIEYGRISILQFISYPLFFQLKYDVTINELGKKVFDRLQNLNFFNYKAISQYSKKPHKILDLNIMHGKETKKDGIMSWFSFEDTCKYCNQQNDSLFYCSIFNFAKNEDTVLNVFQKFTQPLVLLATSECYNLSGDGLVYLESSLYINKNGSTTESYTNNIELKDCLDLFGKDIILSDDDMWYCSKCQKHQISNQKLQIYKSPNYLIIQIKRFNIKKKYGYESTFTGEKNNTFVSYPINDLDLGEYIVGHEKNNINTKYDLYGVVQHFGSLNGGHYTAICKNDNNWITYNDSSLSHCENPVTKNAYILFYKRKDYEVNNSNNDNKEKGINK